MTELSYLWSGIVTGDATQAPYNQTKFNKYVFYPITGGNNGVFVIPGYLDDLEVQAGGTSIMAVKVGAGAAVINGYLYESDTAETLNIEPVSTSTTFSRWDRVILRVDYSAQTIRLAVITGNEALNAEPSTSLNALTQVENSIWECELAQIYVLGSATYVFEQLIYDKRKFINTYETKNNYQAKNLVRNSEFMAFSGSQTAAVDAPEFWTVSGTPTSITSTTALSPSTRGRGLSCNFTSDTLMTQTILLDKATKTISIKGLVYVTNGAPSIQVTGTRSNGVTSTKSYYQTFMRPALTTLEFNKTLTFPEDDIVSLTITWSGAAIFVIGQLIILPGYHPGPFRHFSEVLMFKSAVTDASWTATAKSDSTTTINTTASFGTLVLSGTRALLLRLKGNDSGSAVTATTLAVRGYAAPYDTYYGILEVGIAAADLPRETQMIIPVSQSLYYAASNAPQFRLVVDASGAATFDATVEVLGIVT